MTRGEFSASSRATTFIAVLAEYDVDVQRIKGIHNLPSNFVSRNPQECNFQDCQVCKFVSESGSSVAKKVSIDDVLAGHHPVHYSSRSTCKSLQMECPDLRRVYAHLSKGTRPTNKASKVTTVKRYLRKLTISRDGLLVIQQNEPFLPQRELIVIPQHLLQGITTSLHLYFQHPTIGQLCQVFDTAYYALKKDAAIKSL